MNAGNYFAVANKVVEALAEHFIVESSNAVCTVENKYTDIHAIVRNHKVFIRIVSIKEND